MSDATIMRGDALSGAIFSVCERYRYRLWRIWDPGKPSLLWVMLNPSTADELVLDPTLRRCEGYAKAWGYGAFEVANIFAWRATDPRELRTCAAPVGPVNNSQIVDAAGMASIVVVGWGASSWKIVRSRAHRVVELLAGRQLHCLRTSKSGAPVHPLYQPGDLRLTPWPSAGVRRA